MTRFLAFAALLLAFVPAFGQDAPTPPEGWVAIFNGKDLTGWTPTGNPKVWGAENGVLHVAGGGGGWLMTDKEYKNFEIKLDYKPSKLANSGVALRSPLPKDMPKGKGWDPAYAGMEIQLIDDAHWPGLKDWQHTGSVYNVIPAAKVNPRPIGEWNAIHITAKGSKITVIHNGETLVDGDLADHVKEHSARHPGILREGGHLGLQSHDNRTEFKNIFVKTLD
jgi:3-keto-disaccharide hydrolase